MSAPTIENTPQIEPLIQPGADHPDHAKSMQQELAQNVTAIVAEANTAEAHVLKLASQASVTSETPVKSAIINADPLIEESHPMLDLEQWKDRINRNHPVNELERIGTEPSGGVLSMWKQRLTRIVHPNASLQEKKAA